MQGDYLKDVSDVIKHTTTLSTASIAAVATFVKAISVPPDLYFFVLSSVLCFLFSIIMSVFSRLLFIYFYYVTPESKEEYEDYENLKKMLPAIFMAGEGAFVLGVIMFAWMFLELPFSVGGQI
jgi:hypothetical protein